MGTKSQKALLKGTKGATFPLGPTADNKGVNFCLYTSKASFIELHFFDRHDQSKPSHTFKLDPLINNTGNYWHIYVEGAKPGQLYGYVVHPPASSRSRLQHDPSKLLLDPYAKCIVDDAYDRSKASKPGANNFKSAMKSVVVDISNYDWEGDRPIERPFNDETIYEMHVKGFTANPNSGLPDDIRGTYRGLIEKIPYLQKIGIRCVELLPVFHFDRQAAPEGRVNYWGYQPVSFFAPHRAYSSDKSYEGPINEFRDMVKALHKANIEVILDVVYNHTAEDGKGGPVFSFKGIDVLSYYLLDSKDPNMFVNASGTGNTINANHSVVRRMIQDSLRFWVQEMHVDGFRFDLASVLSRGEDGQPMDNPPILWSIDSDPILAGTKIIAEAWDAAGLYQVGSFVGDRWAVWNGHFRDVVRKFVRGDEGMLSELTHVIGGSPSLFNDENRDPQRSVNFITAHDGFTLNDLVSYNEKHNEANGEDNRDGHNDNLSWNCGVEGPTDDPDIKNLRTRQVKNFFTILMLSQGQPMILMGDEFRNTHRGNNNVYSLDSDVSWFDWEKNKNNKGLVRFFSKVIAARLDSELFKDRNFWYQPEGTDIAWHGLKHNDPDWSHHSRSIAFELFHTEFTYKIYVILNAFSEPLEFELPKLKQGYTWVMLINTALPSPNDFVSERKRKPYEKTSFTAEAHSCAVLYLKRKGI